MSIVEILHIKSLLLKTLAEKANTFEFSLCCIYHNFSEIGGTIIVLCIVDSIVPYSI